MPPLSGIWPFLEFSLRDFGCGKAMFFYDLFRNNLAEDNAAIKGN